MAKYRPNVAAILLRADKKILVAERIKIRGAWQFPQGGVDDGEDLIAALKREVEEEVGLAPNFYELAACRTGYRYKFPKTHSKNGKWRGQDQTYFLCRFRGMDKNFDLNFHEREFAQFKWIAPEEFELNCLPVFKREVYREVFRDFFNLDLKIDSPIELEAAKNPDSSII
ncbi:MAG: putative (di)nucleoside polyphosphate hydrolase [Verrucomicrobiales bacterium]|jgi:putative (di)nucleoside polyphosphate hydrolase